MAGKYLSLEEAAQKLGITSERLRELRDLGEVHGYRDGASWKFKPEEIDRVADELAAVGGMPQSPTADEGSGGSFSGEDLDALLSLDDSSEELESDELDESSILVTEEAAPDGEKDPSTVIGKEDEEVAVSADSDLKLAESGSEIELSPAAEGASGSSVRLAGSDVMADDEGSLKLDESGLSIGGDSIKLADSGDISASNAGDESDFELKVDEGASGSDEFQLSSDELMLESDSGLQDAAENLALSDDDDLLLGEGSASSEDEFELSLGDSGIELAESSDSESVFIETDDSASGSEAELELSDDSLIVPAQAAGDEGDPLQPDEEFMLAPSEDLLSDDSSDSGSQVIALDDSDSASADLGAALVADEASGLENQVSPEMDAFQPADTEFVPTAVAPGVPEAQYSVLNVIWLLLVLMMMSTVGVLMWDIVRNMWSWHGEYAATSWLTDAVVSAFQLNK